MREQKTGIEIWNLDGTGMRCAVAVNGVVRYVGSPERCRCFAQSLLPRSDRERQDQMLLRALS